jgi:hypothetical protein
VPSLTSVASTSPPSDLATRRCWRCLDDFEVAAEPGDRLDGWWLCAPCNDVLLPSKRVPS